MAGQKARRPYHDKINVYDSHINLRSWRARGNNFYTGSCEEITFRRERRVNRRAESENEFTVGKAIKTYKGQD